MIRTIGPTTMATIAGHMPLVFVSGPGSGARNSIGLMLVSGMAIGTLFTLFVLPCVYLVLAKRSAAESAKGPPEPAGLVPAATLAGADR